MYWIFTGTFTSFFFFFLAPVSSTLPSSAASGLLVTQVGDAGLEVTQGCRLRVHYASPCLHLVWAMVLLLHQGTMSASVVTWVPRNSVRFVEKLD
jgi:hypothetical protein